MGALQAQLQHYIYYRAQATHKLALYLSRQTQWLYLMGYRLTRTNVEWDRRMTIVQNDAEQQPPVRNVEIEKENAMEQDLYAEPALQRPKVSKTAHGIPTKQANSTPGMLSAFGSQLSATLY